VFSAVFNCFWFNRIIDYPRLPSFLPQGAGELFKFGAFVALSEVLFVAYNRVDIVITGKFFDIAEVGLYGVTIQLATMLMIKSVPLFNVVAFPAFARMNDASGDRNDYLITTLGFASALIFPIFLGVAMVGKDLIGLVLGSEWVQISGLFAIIVISVPLRILAYIISPALLAAGGARINLTNAFVTLIVLTGAIFAMLPMGLPGIAVAWSLASVCIFVLTLVRGGRVLELPILSALRAVTPALLAALLMCAAIYLVSGQFPGVAGVLALYKIPFGALVYVFLFWLMFRDRSEELIRVVSRLAGRQ
jgi:O-antigen/teichoic acid export membrane protein